MGKPKRSDFDADMQITHLRYNAARHRRNQSRRQITVEYAKYAKEGLLHSHKKLSRDEAIPGDTDRLQVCATKQAPVHSPNACPNEKRFQMNAHFIRILRAVALVLSLLVLTLFASVGLLAQENRPAPARASEVGKTVVIELWPEKVPDEARGIGPERVRMSAKLDRKQVEVTEQTRLITDVTRPSITVCRPGKEKNTGTAVVICPGGGYWDLYWQLEGEEVAAWLNSLDVTGIILKYRVPRRPDDIKGEPARRPLQDAQRAVSLVRGRAREWGINPQHIGIMGFSAGGHLAIATATRFEKRTYEPQDEVDKISCRPDFAILAYPGYLKPKDKDELSPALHVPSGTPPVFLVHGDEDIISPPQHSVVMYLALKRAGVSAELHVYAGSAHDFGVRTNDHSCSAWTKACEEWLRQEGFLKLARTP